MKAARLWIVALTSITLIALELVWTRLFSAEFFYTYAFLALSLAVLGMGLGALAVRFFPRLGSERLAGPWLLLTGLVALAGPRTDIPDLLAAADVFVLTSIREGLPVSLLEAMAAGKAIVAASVGGVPDAISDGETGLLIPPGDAAAAAGAVCRLLDDPALRSSLGRSAVRVAEERFSIDFVARLVGETYVALYERKMGDGA